MNERQDLGLGPRLLAIETTLRELVEHVSATDPAVRQRIRCAAETYLATVPQMSALEIQFIESSRGFIESMVRPPSRSQERQ